MGLFLLFNVVDGVSKHLNLSQNFFHPCTQEYIKKCAKNEILAFQIMNYDQQSQIDSKGGRRFFLNTFFQNNK